MNRLLLIVRHLLVGFAGRCTCDVRFVGVASDVDCPDHGLTALAASSVVAR